MSKERGLPQKKRMRHDSHFVEEITSRPNETIGQMIDIRRIEPNPHQPRRSFGDMADMIASVKEKGILEPILVRAYRGKYQIIAGERRYQAASKAGLQRVPCIEVDVDARGMLEISLIENLQRRDLTPFEEAAAIQRLSDQFRYTHGEIARKLGKSRTVITEALSLNKIPDEVQERCRQADIVSKSMLLQIVRQQSVEDMHRLLDKITGEGLTREEARDIRPAGKPVPRKNRQYIFRYEPEDQTFQVRLTFAKAEVDPNEIIGALERIIEGLRNGDPEPAADGSRPSAGRKTGRSVSWMQTRPDGPGARVES